MTAIRVNNTAVFVAQIVGDGVTDDTAAWNAAIARAVTAGGGEVVPSRYGTCKITGTGIRINTNTHISVNGYGIKLQPAIGATCLSVDAAGTGGSAVGASFEGFTIDGLGHATSTGVRIRNSERVRVSDMNIQNLTTGIAILNDGTSSGLPTGNGNGYCEDNHFENLYIASCTTGVDFQSTNGSNTSLEENTFHHVGISGCTTGIKVAQALELRAVVMNSMKIWCTTPGGQTGISIDGNLQDWVAQIHFESLAAQSNQTAIHLTTNATNPDLAHLDFGFVGTWTNKVVVDTGTIGLAFQQGRDRMLGGKVGGFVRRYMRDTDNSAWPRMQFALSPATISLGAGTAVPDLTLNRATDASLNVNKPITINSVAVVTTDDSRLTGLAGGSSAGRVPTDYGWLTWNMDPLLLDLGGVVSNANVNGVPTLVRLPIISTITATNVVVYLGTLGGTATTNGNWAAIYKSDGTRVAVSATQDAVFGSAGSTGLKTIPMTATTSLIAGSYVWVCLLVNTGSTVAGFARTSASTNNYHNMGLATSTYVAATNGTGKTVTDSPLTVASNVASTSVVWAAIS